MASRADEESDLTAKLAHQLRAVLDAVDPDTMFYIIDLPEKAVLNEVADDDEVPELISDDDDEVPELISDPRFFREAYVHFEANQWKFIFRPSYHAYNRCDTDAGSAEVARVCRIKGRVLKELSQTVVQSS